MVGEKKIACYYLDPENVHFLSKNERQKKKIFLKLCLNDN